MTKKSTTKLLIERMRVTVFERLLAYGFFPDPVASKLEGWSGQVWIAYFARREGDRVHTHLAIVIFQSNPIEVKIELASTQLSFAVEDNVEALKNIFDFCELQRRGSSVALWDISYILVPSTLFIFSHPFRLSKGSDLDETTARVEKLCKKIGRELDRQLENVARRALRRPVVVPNGLH